MLLMTFCGVDTTDSGVNCCSPTMELMSSTSMSVLMSSVLHATYSMIRLDAPREDT